MFNKKLVTSRFTWAGHVKRMEYEKLAKRADAKKVEGKEARKSELETWDCIKKEIERVGEEWRKIQGIGDC